MSDPIVQIDLGQLKGRVAQDADGDNYYSFQGIPYAKPPLGNLRFRAPQPPEPWIGIRDATKENNECFHRHLALKTPVGSEDCLFLNVYTKNLSGPLKPVMVWIHGGAYVGGSGNEEFYGPEYFMTQDVVFVTINYRVGLLGFLSLEDPALGVPGNAGLKDQVMALKWVQKYIKSFGGDSNNVTILGESAGGASVHLLMLSPMAKGLFHKCIAQSGMAMCPWAIGRRCSEELCENFNLSIRDEKNLLEHMMKATKEEILQGQEKLADKFIVSIKRPHGPIIETKIPQEEAFLSEDPIDILLSGNYTKVPLMAGFTTREGMLFAVMADKSNPHLYEVNFEDMVPYYLNYKRGSKQSLELAQKIKEFYFGNQEASKETSDNNFMMKSDIVFIRGIYSCVKNHVATSTTPVYLYRFALDGSLNLFKAIGEITTPGACHADDLSYLFKIKLGPTPEPDSVEDKTIKRMVKLWTNFAKNGNPNPIEKDPLINVVWQPVKENCINYLNIDTELKADVNPEQERMKFWDNVFQKHPTVCKL